MNSLQSLLLALVAAFCLLAAGCTPQTSNRPGPVIVVETDYPGASAQTVADTLAAPIEQQVNGAEHMLSLSSQSTADGTYTLRVLFQPGTDPDVAQREVQNRTQLALPALPEVVRARGLAVRKKIPEPLLLVSLTSQDSSIDTLYLSNFARIQIQNELARVPGVADVSLFGAHDSRLQLAIDADRLTAFNLTLINLVTALREQNFQVERGTPGENGELRLACNATGKPVADPEALASVFLQANNDGTVVRMRDVAQVEVARKADSFAALNSDSAVLLGIHVLPNARPQEVSQAVGDKLKELRATTTPDAIELAVAVDFSASRAEHLIIDLDMPAGTSTEQMISVLERAEEIVQKTSGVQTVVATTTHPCTLRRNQPSLIVVGAPKQSLMKTAGELRTKLAGDLPGCLVTVCGPSKGSGSAAYSFPIEFVMEDTSGHGNPALLAAADTLVQKLNQSGKFADVRISSGLRLEPGLHYDVDRERCSTMGVSVTDLLTTLDLQPPTPDLGQQRIKNKDGELIPLTSLVRVMKIAEPSVIERHNLYPAVRVTANLATGTQLRAAKTLCEELAKTEFGQQGLRLQWTR